MSGYVGKILFVDLTAMTVDTIDTSLYEAWGGGHGIGSALFYDIVVKQNNVNLAEIDGFHPKNLLTVMTSPLSATGVPSATARTEVQGIGVHSYPIGWYTRSMIGGRIGPMLKFAGYDGIAVFGKASAPVWIDIRDDSVEIRPCEDLGIWGKDTFETQKTIHKYVMGEDTFNTWITPEGLRNNTTQMPAVLTMGQAGESLCRFACLMSDGGYAAGAGGFGAVMGAKNLKAISALGTGSVPVDDPAGLVRERIERLEKYGPKVEGYNPLDRALIQRQNSMVGAAEAFGMTPTDFFGASYQRTEEEKRPASCMGCYAGCRARYENSKANESHCAGCFFYAQADDLETMVEATDMVNRYGFNTFDLFQGVPYFKDLADRGIIGPGAEIDSGGLDWSKFGKIEWAQQFLDTIVTKDTPFGEAVSEGLIRALETWGRLDDIGDALEKDKSHINIPYWGLPEHHYDPRCQLEYGYGAILGDRDLCEHYFSAIFLDWAQTERVKMMGMKVRPLNATGYQHAYLSAKKMTPHNQDYDSIEDAMMMLDYSTSNMYSEHIVRLVSWHRHYSRFWKASMLFCDWKYPDIINSNPKNGEEAAGCGSGQNDGTPEAREGGSFETEEIFFKLVTGKDFSFLDGMRIGRKIWILDNVIWTLQGRNRDMIKFSDYIYDQKYPHQYGLTTYRPNALKDKWALRNVGGRSLDREGFEEFKTKFYTYEGWNPDTGWPTRSTLESLGMGEVADTLENWEKLG